MCSLIRKLSMQRAESLQNRVVLEIGKRLLYHTPSSTDLAFEQLMTCSGAAVFASFWAMDESIAPTDLTSASFELPGRGWASEK